MQPAVSTASLASGTLTFGRADVHRKGERLPAASVASPVPPAVSAASTPPYARTPGDADDHSGHADDYLEQVPTTIYDYDADEAMPRLPCAPSRMHPTHREKTGQHQLPDNACVARPVRGAELKEKPAPQAAMQREWDRLRSVVRPDGTLGCWDEHLVREWRDVRRDARAEGKQAHVSLAFGIVVEKNAELCLAEPFYKGRAVFQGRNVRDVNGEWAIFQELGSCPATMEAARCADAYGPLHGHTVQQLDAGQAHP